MKSISTSAKRNLRTTALFAAIAFLLSPSLFVVSHALGHLSGDWLEHFARTVLPSYLETTSLVLAGAALTAVVLGGLPAWLTHRYRFKGHRFATVLQLMPMTMPAYVLAGIYLEASSAPFFESAAGLAFEMGIATAPWLFLFLRVAMSRIPSVFEEAARTLGQGFLARMTRLHLPLLLAPLCFSLLMVSAETLGDFGAASRVGVETFGVGLHHQWQALQRTDVGTILVFFLLAMILLLALPAAILTLRRPLSSSNVVAQRSSVQNLSGVHGSLAFATCAIAVVPGFLFPVSISAVWAWQKLPRMRLDTLYVDAFGTLLSSGLVVVTCSMIALVLTTLLRPGERSGWAERSAWIVALNSFLPALVFAVAILELGRSGSFFAPFWEPLHSSRLLLVVASSIRFLPFMLIPVVDAMIRTPASLVDAARTLGSSPIDAFRRVLLPQLKAAFVAGAILVFVESAKELTVSLLLQPFDYRALSLRIFSYTGLYMVRESSVWVLCLVLICIFPVWALSAFLETNPGASGDTRGTKRARG